MYSKEDIKAANKLFFLLLKKGELQEKDDNTIFKEYLSNENMREILEIISNEGDFAIKMIGDSIYLLPNPYNEIIGFDYRTTDLGTSLNDSYLGFWVITIIFAEFTNEIDPVQYLNIIDIMGLVSESFERAARKENIEEEEVEAGINLLELKRIWDSKLQWDEGAKIKQDTIAWEYKIGVVRKVIIFLKKNDLVTYYQEEDRIYPSDKFNNLMFNHFINIERKALIEKLFSEEEIPSCQE